MEYTVFLQPHASGGFIATVPAIPGCQSIGATEEEAVSNVTINIKDFLRKTKIIRITVDENGSLSQDPWNEVIGIFVDDETFEDFQSEIKKYRKRMRK
jgi:hypothetical protein